MRYIYPLIAALVLLPGCNSPEDKVEDIKDLRLLAIKATPPEIQLLADGSSQQISFELLLVDPRGGDVTVQWQACPSQSEYSCADPDWPADDAWDPDCFLLDQDPLNIPLLTPFYDQQTNEQAFWNLEQQHFQETISAITPRQISTTTFHITADPALFYAYFSLSSICGLTGSWPNVMVSITKSDEEALVGFKRFVLNYGDLEPMAQAIGIESCNGTDPSPDCIPIPHNQPNQNPSIETVAFNSNVDDSDENNFIEIPSIASLVLQPGQEVRILPTLTQESQEEFYQFVIDFFTQKINIETDQEEISVSFFKTLGDISDQFTWGKTSKDLSTVYTAPTITEIIEHNETDPDTIACQDLIQLFPYEVFLYMVARDNRGGVDWRVLPIEIALPTNTSAIESKFSHCF